MNFSNFIIGKLTDTESTFALGSKKTVSNPFLFSDIIKVCEQENEVQLNGVLGSANPGQTQEVFSASENVVNLNNQDFVNLLKQLTELFNVDSEIQPTETTHKVENADITKLQFVVSEEKLVELAGDFVEKSGYSLIPMSNLSESNQNSKPLTISYKNGLNKVSISINPIKVDENYTNKAINDDFNFVNKLLVDEGLIQSFTSNTGLANEDNSKNLLALDANTDLAVEDAADENSAGKIFFKAEIIKIESLLNAGELIYSTTPIISLANSELSSLDAQLKQADELSVNKTNNISDKYASSLVTESNSVENSLDAKTNSQVESKIASKVVELTPNTNNAVQSEVIIPKITSEPNTLSKSLPLVNIASSVEAASDNSNLVDNNKVVDLGNLMEGLTEEEKSVFKSFKESGELNEISFTKSSAINNANQTEIQLEKTTGDMQTVKKDFSSEQNVDVDKLPATVAKEEVSDNSVKSDAKVEVVKEIVTKNLPNTNEHKIETKVQLNPVVTDGKPKLISKEEFVSLDVKKTTTQTQKVQESADQSSLSLGSDEENLINSNNAVPQQKEAVEQKTTAAISEKAFEVLSSSKLQMKMPAKASYKIESDVQNNAEVKIAKQINNLDVKLALDESPVTTKKQPSVVDSQNNGEAKVEKQNKSFEINQTNNDEKVTAKDVKLNLNESSIATKKQPSVVDSQNSGEAKVEKQNKSFELNQTTVDEEVTAKEVKSTFSESSITAKMQSTVVGNQNNDESKNEKPVNNFEVKQTKQDEKSIAAEIKYGTTDTSNKNVEKAIQITAVESEALNTSKKEKATTQNVEVDVKESANVQSKEAKATLDQQKYSQSEKESSKSNTSDNFKNHFNQTLGTDKGFDVEAVKHQTVAKHSSEIFKTVKQQEIIPELSKLVLQGDKQTMTLQLTPENLGKVKLTVDMVENQIVTKIEVENEQVKQFVQSNLDQLKQNMQSAGITLTNVNVSLSDEQKNQKLFTQKKKSQLREDKEEILEAVSEINSKKHMGYNTYEFTA